MVEPGSHGEQAEVHGGGGGEEGGAGDEHSRREDQDCQTESAHVGSELTQDSAVEVHLKRVRYLSKQEEGGNWRTSQRAEMKPNMHLRK